MLGLILLLVIVFGAISFIVKGMMNSYVCTKCNSNNVTQHKYESSFDGQSYRQCKNCGHIFTLLFLLFPLLSNAQTLTKSHVEVYRNDSLILNYNTDKKLYVEVEDYVYMYDPLSQDDLYVEDMIQIESKNVGLCMFHEDADMYFIEYDIIGSFREVKQVSIITKKNEFIILIKQNIISEDYGT